jgi:peptide/nickel transport system substrate-binding protein
MFRRKGKVGVSELVGVGLLMITLLGFLTSASAEQPQIAVYAYSAEVMIGWDPSDAFSDEIVVMNNVYERLLNYDPFKDEFEPVLATSYEKSADGKIWTFYLRKGVKFHTGRGMDAEAVKFSIERTINRGKGAAFIWDSVESIEVVDKYTVRFYLKYPAALDLVAAAAYAAYIFDPEAADHEWFIAGHEAGTGPYMFESYVGITRIVLKRFDDYWRGWEGPHFDKVVFITVPEPSTRRLMIESGEADFTNRLPVTEIEALQGNPDVEITRTPSYQNLVAQFNTEKPPLDNPLVRKALAYTIPYEDIVEGVLMGYGRQSRGVIPYGLWGYSDRVTQYTLSLETAEALLAKAGYPDGGFKLLLTYVAGDAQERRVAELWKEQLAKLGIELEPRGMPWDPQWALARSPDPNARQDIFVMYWWPDYTHPHSFMLALFGTEEEISFNLDYYSNPLYDYLIDEAMKLSATDREEAINLYVEAQNVLMADMPGLAIYDMEYVRPKRASLKGYVDNPSYPHVVFWYDCYRE